MKLDDFKTPKARAILTIAGITAATSITLQILPKNVSVVMVSMGAGLVATNYFVKKLEESKIASA